MELLCRGHSVNIGNVREVTMLYFSNIFSKLAQKLNNDKKPFKFQSVSQHASTIIKETMLGMKENEELSKICKFEEE